MIEELPYRNPDNQFFPSLNLFRFPWRRKIRFVDKRGCMAEIRVHDCFARSVGVIYHNWEWWVKLRKKDDNRLIYTPLRYIIGYKDSERPIYEGDWYGYNLPK